MIHPPNRISDASPLSNWLNRLRDFAASTAIQNVNGGFLQFGSAGATLNIPSAFTQATGDVTYGGEYDAGTSYANHTLVYQRHATKPIYMLWISEQPVPVSTVPTLPEPEAPDLYWRLLATTGDTVDIQVCIDGVADTITLYTPLTTWPM